jgi:hypothetical protein
MNRSPVICLLAVAAFAVAACSNEPASPKPAEQAATAKPAAGTQPGAAKVGAPAEAELPKIPILPDYKYYVGGPLLKEDAYNKFRITKFNSEVQQPPSRGMVFGAKQEGDKLEYKVWGNGRLLGYHKGTMRDGLFWPDYVEGYRQGALVAREYLTHDDAAKKTRIITEDLDPETGEVIRKKEMLASYYPPVVEGEEGEDEEDSEGGAAAPKAPPAAGAPAAPSPAAPAAPAPAAPAPAAPAPAAPAR